MKSGAISFLHNFNPVEINFASSDYSTTTTVLKYLRSLQNYKGTKEGCGEGDCGACTVVIAQPEDGNLVYRAVDSCLVFLPSLHGKQLITVEALQDKDGKLHPVQQALVENFASQCGFCTPGFVMSLFALYKSTKKISKTELTEAISGNLCRCTGYKPIIQSGIEIMKNIRPDQFDHNASETILLLNQINRERTIEINDGCQTYFIPFTISDALKLKKEHPEALITAGNTDNGLKVTKKHQSLPLIIDVSALKELRNIKKAGELYAIGSGVTIESLHTFSKKIFPAIYSITGFFGSRQIRNVATIGGNIGSASPIGDLLPILIAYRSVVTVRGNSEDRKIPLSDFITSYRTTDLKPDEIIVCIEIPVPDKSKFYWAYKLSKRKNLDISTCSAAFRFGVNESTGKIEEAVLVFGGMSATVIRARKTEDFLINKKFSLRIIQSACKILKEEFLPIADARSGIEFRKVAAANLLLKFFNEISAKAK